MSTGQSSGRLSIIQAYAYDDVRMTSELRDVLGILGSYASTQTGWCYGKQETIAARLGIARESVNRRLARLVSLGYVEIRHRYRKDGGMAPNDYRIRYDFQLPLDRYRLPPVPESDDRKPVEKFAPPVMEPVTPPVMEPVTPPVMEPVTTPTPLSQRLSMNEEPISKTSSIAPADPAAPPSAATPRECGFAFLETEPLYLEASRFLPPPTTRAEIGKWARAIADLREVGATLEQLRQAIRNFRTMYPRAHLTITAVSGQWTLLLQGDKPYAPNGANGGSHEGSREAGDSATQREAKARREAEYAAALAQAIEELGQPEPAQPAVD